MTQTYQDPLAVDRMRHDLCPECGNRVGDHGGWAGLGGCSLTDNGVADRIAAQHSLDAATKSNTQQRVTDAGVCT